jgi:HIP---CoA ligase
VAPNSPALVIALLAAWRAGAVPVPLNARLREYELRAVLADAEPSAVVSVRESHGFSFADLMRGLVPDLPTVRDCLLLDGEGTITEELSQAPEREAEPTGEQIGAILYTSGTTGEPKGALVPKVALLGGGRALADLLALEPEDTTALVIPASHAFGLGCLLAALVSGGRTLLVESTFSLDPLMEAVERFGATVLHGSPALFAGVLGSGLDRCASVRAGFVGGATCPPGIIEQLDAAGLKILNVYGMTEIGAASSCRFDDPAEVRYTTVGRPLPDYEFRIVPGAMKEPGLGELQVRGPQVTTGYHRSPERTAEAFDGEWFRTGDLGTIDDRGNLRISGRAKELVQVAGFNVFPAEVENFLLTHPDVAQAAVVGVPHETRGESLRAFVVPREGSELTAAALRGYLRRGIAGYKIPYDIQLLAELPLLPSGKADRAALSRVHA